MGGVVVDLKTNTVNGKKVMPRICELAWCLADGKPVTTEDLVPRMYGPNEPQNAIGALRQTAFLARRAGLDIRVSAGRPRGATKGAKSPGPTYRLAF